MSQILDALRRAEAQRLRGRVPGLHETVGQGVPTSSQPTMAQPSRRLLMVVAVLVVIGLIVALLVTTRSAEPVRAQALRGDAPVIADAPLGITPSTAQDETAGAKVNPLGIEASIEPPPKAGLPRTAQLSDNRNEPRTAAPRAVADPLRGLAGATDPVEKPPSAATSAAPAVAALPTRQALPPEVQRSLPPLTVSGSVYSTDAAQRILMINGELWHEGDEIRPGLVLEQIRRRDAVMKFNGIRFTVAP